MLAFRVITSLLVVALMFALFPLVLKFTPSIKIRYLNKKENDELELSDKLAESIKSITVVKFRDRIVGADIVPMDGVDYLDVSFALKREKKTNVSSFKLNFKKERIAKITFKNACDELGLYINQINDGPYNEKILTTITKKRAKTFAILESLCIFYLSIMMMCAYIDINDYIWNTLGAFAYVSFCLVFDVILSIGIYYLTFIKLEKYFYGGITND